MHRREAEDARFAKSQILDEKLGQEEELEALREHCSVVTSQNRHVSNDLVLLSFKLIFALARRLIGKIC